MASRSGASSALVALSLLLQLALLQGETEPMVPAMFVFGDSTVDVGNNNYLSTSIDCRADHPRYGVDYLDQAPTGRFSNGYNLADHLARLLGFAESPPPFLSLPDLSRIPQMMSTGINFASGGSGVLEDTGRHLCGQVLSMNEQLEYFWDVATSANQTAAADLISKSLFFISVGSNDVFENVDVQDPNRNVTEFLQQFVSSYSFYLEKGLYNAGARKFSVVSPSLVGCCPSQRLLANKSKELLDRFNCLAPANNLSNLVYSMIASMLHDLSAKLPGMSYSLVDSIRMAEWVLNNTHATPGNSFTVLDTACCGTGDFRAGACNVSAPLCQNRSSYLFWDSFHPTEDASRITASGLFNDSGRFVHPINVQQLVASHP